MKQLAIIIRAEELKEDDDRPSNVYSALISQSKQDESTRKQAQMRANESRLFRLLPTVTQLGYPFICSSSTKNAAGFLEMMTRGREGD